MLSAINAPHESLRPSIFVLSYRIKQVYTSTGFDAEVKLFENLFRKRITQVMERTCKQHLVEIVLWKRMV